MRAKLEKMCFFILRRLKLRATKSANPSEFFTSSGYNVDGLLVDVLMR